MFFYSQKKNNFFKSSRKIFLFQKKICFLKKSFYSKKNFLITIFLFYRKICFRLNFLENFLKL